MIQVPEANFHPLFHSCQLFQHLIFRQAAENQQWGNRWAAPHRPRSRSSST